MSNFKLKNVEFPTSAWWCEVYQNISDDQITSFLEKLQNILRDAPGKSYLRAENSIVDSLARVSFMSTVLDKSWDLYRTRSKLVHKIKSVSAEPTRSIINSAISCHLRPNGRISKCIYCEAEDIFKSYETKLFRFDESTEVSPSEDSVCFQSTRRGTHADSDLELVLKCLLNYSRHCNDSLECTEDGGNELKLMEALKKEFKCLRALWIRCNEYVSQIDEIEMAKISARLLLPDETPPNPSVPYILLPHEVQSKSVQYSSDVISHQFELKKKMGQLFYLQNLQKAGNKDRPFDECCPICRQKFGKSWSVLQCGHNFCLRCIGELFSCQGRFTNNLGFVSKGMHCPVCRQLTASSDVYYIDNDVKKEEENDIPIKGSYSTKISAVVKCLLQISKNDPGAKSLVFSSFTDFLHILECALEDNNVQSLNLHQKNRFQDNLRNFKQSKDFNVLLIPLNLGGNGLNIIEATHVLLLEPVLDYAKHLQAVGRVHRIGQKKMATVHKFIVSNTIDESIYDIIKDSSSCGNSGKTELTLESLKHIFSH